MALPKFTFHGQFYALKLIQTACTLFTATKNFPQPIPPRSLKVFYILLSITGLLHIVRFLIVPPLLGGDAKV